MTTIDDSYNDFAQFPLISATMIETLMSENELVWRLLKYSDPHAYKLDTEHPNLTTTEKQALIYDGVKVETDCRVFMDVGQFSAWTDEVCVLRITPVELIPVNRTIGNVVIALEIYCHNATNTLSNYQTRLNMISQQLIQLFNGRSVGGIGKLYFDARANSRCKMIVGGQIPFKANVIQMCNWVV